MPHIVNASDPAVLMLLGLLVKVFLAGFALGRAGPRRDD